jgi:ribosome-associated translation inhibitor RaiA
LHINLERNPKKPLFVAALTLRLPSNILQSEKTGSDPIPAVDKAVKALLREVAVLKSELRRESDWQTVAKRKE